ncbi:MAG: hypothetical protein ACREQY_00995 [Candidatus Binatia bacterium]
MQDDRRLGDTLPTPAPGGAPPPFLAIRDVARFAPFSAKALESMIARGVLRRGEHYHKVPVGKSRRRVVIDWEKFVEFIRTEGTGEKSWPERTHPPTPAAVRSHERANVGRGGMLELPVPAVRARRQPPQV